jgi:hypothetical protein
MVAYNFKPRFAEPILAGTKRHTIRAARIGRVRHAREGEELQLFTGLRTPACKLIARRRCIGIRKITLLFDDDPEYEGIISPGFGIADWGYASLDDFAVGDGFANWGELKAFWRETHRVITEFEGVIIFWQPEAEEALLHRPLTFSGDGDAAWPLEPQDDATKQPIRSTQSGSR